MNMVHGLEGVAVTVSEALSLRLLPPHHLSERRSLFGFGACNHALAGT